MLYKYKYACTHTHIYPLIHQNDPEKYYIYIITVFTTIKLNNLSLYLLKYDFTLFFLKHFEIQI